MENVTKTWIVNAPQDGMESFALYLGVPIIVTLMEFVSFLFVVGFIPSKN